MNFNGLCFCFGRWCCLYAKFYGFNSTSIMQSVGLRSGAQLSSLLVYVNETNHVLILLYSKMQDPSLYLIRVRSQGPVSAGEEYLLRWGK